MEQLECPDCGPAEPSLYWHFMPTVGTYHLGARCSRCERWLKWLRQTSYWLHQAPPKPETGILHEMFG